MMRPHRHQWVEQRRTFAASPAGSFEAERATAQMMREVVFGMTTIEDRCKICNQLRTVTVTGDARR